MTNLVFVFLVVFAVVIGLRLLARSRRAEADAYNLNGQGRPAKLYERSAAVTAATVGDTGSSVFSPACSPVSSPSFDGGCSFTCTDGGGSSCGGSS